MKQDPAVDAAPAAAGFAALVLTALACALAGILSLYLAIPPGNVAPFNPCAGIALVAVLVYGWRVLAGVLVGALLAGLTLSAQHGGVDAVALGVALVIAAGATLQAGVGAWLVKRFVQQPLTLGEPRDIGLFFGLGAVLASVVSASVATAVHGQMGAIAPNAAPYTWLAWWAGDTMGVLIGAPVVLTLIGRPRTEWAPRRLSVGLTLALATAFVATGIAQVARWDAERARNVFERDTDNATSAFRAQLQEPLHALEALRGVFAASDEVTADELRRATRAWLEPGNLLAMGWSERVPRSGVAAFESKVRAQGRPDYRVFDRTDAAGAAATPADADVVAIRHIEPLHGNAAALGVNAMSIPAARAAMAYASRTSLPAVTAGFRLTQVTAGQDETGVVIYAALYSGMPLTAQDRENALRGVVFVTLRPDVLLGNVVPQLPRNVKLCVVDTDPGAPRRRLAGPPGCDTPEAGTRRVRPIAFAGRQWDLQVYSLDDELALATGANAWLFAMVGFMAAAVLGALLLTVTGRARRIEDAVRVRTAALQAEILVREQAQAELQESEQRFRNILDNVPIGIVYTDLHGRVIKANPRFCDLIGYTEAQLLLMNVPQLTHPDDVAQDVSLSTRLVQGEMPMYRCQKRYVAHDGQTVWAQSTVSLLRDAQGRPRHIVGAVEDITERLRLQGAEHARKLAEASNRAKSEFLSRMSHELRTPLNAILGFAQLLEMDQRQPLATVQRPWVSQIQQAGWHLLEMINDVLDLSRIESGNLRLQSEPLQLAELIEAAISLVKADADRRGITITTQPGVGGVAVLGDATRVRQIVINLLSNAVKYNVDGGHVEVSARMNGSLWAEASVTDSGIGMTPEQIAALFVPFNRLGRESSSQQGTGIGLVISKSLAELMGGSLRAIGAAGRGMTFTLTLPSGTSPSPAAPEPGPAAMAGACASYADERVVLYIEDNETNVEVMRGVLAQRPQVRLEIATTGRAGVAAALSCRPNLILLDMHLPDTTGLEVLEQLRAHPATAGIPVLAVSADALQPHIDAALVGGAVGYLTKPVSVSGLLQVLDETLSPSTSA